MWITFALLLGTMPVAWGCPVCSSPTGVQVREGIFNESFWRNAAVTLAPFPIFAAGVAWIFWGGKPRASNENKH